MKISQELKKIVKNALKELIKANGTDIPDLPEPVIETPKVEGHGDYATNIAMIMASRLKAKPRDVAEKLKAIIEGSDNIIENVTIAGPGFVNFVLKKARCLDVLSDVFKEGENYGKIDIGKGERVQVEFVSANPTGPLHVGHGRGAIYGDVLASVLRTAGFDVSKEYYLNDAGNQIQTLGRSLYLRLKELDGETVEFPENCYQGHYIVEIAREVKSSKNYASLSKMSEDNAIAWCSKHAADIILEEIKEDMAACGVTFDNFFSETTLHNSGEVLDTIKAMEKKGYIYESEGALWFKTTEFGDEKDRVLKKSSGEYTYFAADIAYHRNKFERGFERLIDVWGADHGGHVPRMKAAIEAIGRNPDKLDLVLIQLVSLIRSGETVSMSTRKATYETFRSLVEDVGKDVCRYFFLMRSHNAQLDFDVELARKQSPENPVYYIQYAHARISSVFKKAAEVGIDFDPNNVDSSFLELDEEVKMARFLGEFPSVIRSCAVNLEPHKLAFYLLELARIFQSYYSQAKRDERYKVLGGDKGLVQAKLYLLKNIQIVLKNGLTILGIDAPERMETREE